MAPTRKLTTEEQNALAAVAGLTDDQIDTSDPDAPEVKDWSRAVWGGLYRPVKEPGLLELCP